MMKRMKHFSLHRRYSKRTVWIIAAITPLVILVIGGGVYAAFIGGGVRPSSSTDIDLQKGLVGHWKFDGNARDSTPNANNGTVTAATLTSDRKAKTSSSYAFNGSSAYITVPDSNVLTQTTITVSAWVNPSSTGTLKNIFSKASNNEYRYRLTATNQVQVLDRGATNIVTTTATVPINQWSLISFTGDSTGIKIYINGQLSTSGGTAFAPTNTTGVLTLGGNFANSELFGGSLDDIRLYSRVLSAGEISALYSSYNVGLKVNAGENGLVAKWKLDGNAKDSSPNAFNGTISSTTATTDRKGKANSAMNFTGASGSYISVANNSKLQVSSGTVSAWVKPAGGSGFQGIVAKQNAYGLFLNSSTLVIYDWGAGQTRSTGQNLTNGVWYHVAVTFQSGVTNGTVVYLNGSPVLTTTMTVQAQTSGVSIGSGFVVGNGQNLNGVIDDGRIYNRILAASEIDYLSKSYNAQVNLHSNPTSSTASNLSTGLRGWWSLNGNARDSTPYASNMTSIVGASLTTDRKGRANSAYVFNGSPSRYLSASTNSALAFTDNFTLSAWINPTSYKTTGYFGLKNGILARGPATTYNYAMQATDANTISFIERTGSEGLQFTNFTGVPTLTNTWTLVTITISGGTARLYINGSLHASAAVGAIGPGAADQFIIGSVTQGGNDETGIVGKVDDVRVYGRALSAGEVSSLYSMYY